MKLKQSNVDILTTGKADAILFDDDIHGFGLRIREGGTRTYIVQYKIGGKQRRMTLGSTKELKLEQARDAAKGVLAKVHLGGDPAGDKIAARATVAASAAESDLKLGAVAERFLAYQKPRLRPASYKSARLYLLGGASVEHLKPLHDMRLDQIHRRDVASRLSIIAAESGAVTADRVRSNLSSLYAWAIGEGLVDTNPTVGVTKHAADIKPRDRVLDDNELVAIWNAVPKRFGQHYGSVIRLLSLTGCRADEIAWLKWSEVDLEGKVIHLPADRVKNGVAFDVPLSDLALDILNDMDRYPGRDLVFGIRGGGFQGWSKSKAELEVRLPADMKMKAWRVHDIRRSVATGLGKLKVPPHEIEEVLNHRSGHRKGIAGIYQRYDYAAEKRAALDAWAQHISVILAQASGANVTKLSELRGQR